MTTTPTSESTLLTAKDLASSKRILEQLQGELDRQLLGRPELHRLVLAGILSRGHILLEGLPGLGKTALVNCLGRLLGLEFKRVQFTPDLMPADIVGHHVLEETESGSRRFVFHAGPVFTNLLLADEINRSSPKTQAALLEAMQERSVTLLGTTRKLPEPFFVLASQNPIELEGTYPLPEAQQDRFLFRLVVEAPSTETIEAIITSRRRGELPPAQTVLSAEDLTRLYGYMERVYLPGAVANYIARLVAATHAEHPEAPPLVRQYVRYGASPRAAIAIAEAARAMALLAGRPAAGFEDVAAVTEAVLNHRLILAHTARFEGVTSFSVIAELLQRIEQAPLGLPADVRVR